jgi:thiol-disulfide isomerase/thioredoxin
MKIDIHRKIEIAANIAIMVVAALLCVVLVKNYLIPHPALTANGMATDNQIQTGAKISMQEIDWAKNGQTLLLALSTTCHFCSESAPFYQRLVKELGSNTRIVAILPQSLSDSKDYLNRLGVSVDDIRQVQFSSLGVKGTPTLILVDNNGIVRNSWMGKLRNNEEEARVIDQVRQSIVQK